MRLVILGNGKNKKLAFADIWRAIVGNSVLENIVFLVSMVVAIVAIGEVGILSDAILEDGSDVVVKLIRSWSGMHDNNGLVKTACILLTFKFNK